MVKRWHSRKGQGIIKVNGINPAGTMKFMESQPIVVEVQQTDTAERNT